WRSHTRGRGCGSGAFAGRSPMAESLTQSPPFSPGLILTNALVALGDWAAFAGRTLTWTLRRRPGPGTFVPICYAVGVRSVLVVAVTGTFIGMVLSVQSYGQFRPMGL